MPVDVPMFWVAPADVVTVAAGRLLSTAWSGRVVPLVSGPEDHTFLQVAAIVREVTGWPVTYTRTCDEGEREGLREAGFSEAGVESIVGMSVSLPGSYDAARDRDLFSSTTTPLTDRVRQHLVGKPGKDGS